MVDKEEKERIKKNSFAGLNKMVERSGGYGTQEEKCELIGFRYCEKIDKKEITLDQAIKDIVEYTRWHNMKANKVQYCWLSLHLALGMCFQYKITDKEMIRFLLLKLLPYSRGIDMGLFMRDLLHYEDLSCDNTQIEKSLYCLAFCAGFIVNLEKDGLQEKIFKGPARIVYKDVIRAGSCYYLDIPIGHPTLLMTESTSEDNHIGTQSLNLACENLKPNVVLLLLRFGISPYSAIQQLLETLGAARIIGRTASHPAAIDAPMEIVEECLKNCLKAVKHITLCFEGETFADSKAKENKQGVYYVNEGAKKYVPEEYFQSPCPLKQSCRCEIRDILLKSGQIPCGVQKLPILSNEMKDYVDLKC